RRLGAAARTGGLPRPPRRQRPADAPRARRVSRARRQRRPPVPRARPRRDRRVVLFRRRVPAGPSIDARTMEDRVARARGVGARRVGGPERTVPALRLLGPRPARELLRLVHAAERRAAARGAGDAAGSPPWPGRRRAP